MERLKDAICELVGIAYESEVTYERYRELDEAGATIISCLDELKAYRDAEEQKLAEIRGVNDD